MGFWEQIGNKMKVVLLGVGTVPYLYEIQRCLDSQGIICKIKQQEQSLEAVQGYQIKLETATDFDDIEVICCETPPLEAVNCLKRVGSYLQMATHIINIVPIKWFSEFRYNVDNHWEGIEHWIQPYIYQRTLYSLTAKSAQISWVLAEAEKAGVSNSFFSHDKNSQMFTISPQESDFDETAIQTIVKNFLCDIGELVFCQQMRENEFVGLGFSSSGIGEYLISERANQFWVLNSFSQVLKAVNLTIPSNQVNQ